MGLVYLMFCGELISWSSFILTSPEVFIFCLFDVRSDPQALNDFLHGTNEVKQNNPETVTSREKTGFVLKPPAFIPPAADGRPAH